MSQGWSPGNFLGAKDAPHASSYSKASGSHIRVAMRDENLGLGAKLGAKTRDDQCTGLDVFQDVLGRLNGKGQTEIEADQKSRAGLRRAIYAEKRWGSLRFVSGGLLVGDRIQKFAEENSQVSAAPKCMLMQPLQVPAADKPEDEVTNPKTRNHIEESPKLRNAEKPKRTKNSKRPTSADETSELNLDRTLPEGRKIGTTLTTSSGRNTPADFGSKQSSPGKAQRQANKEERKLQRNLRRAAKKTSRAEQGGGPSEMPTIPSVTQLVSPSITERPSRQKAETTDGRQISSLNPPAGGRHAVRQRYIRHKKMAMMDTKALNEVWRRQTLSCDTWAWIVH